MTSLPTKYEKTPGFATTAGQSYEYKMAALVFLRACCAGREFQLATNVKGAGAFDDVILKVRRTDAAWNTYYVQLKHKAGFLTRSMLLAAKGNFSLPKYLESYREIQTNMASSTKQALLEGAMEHCQFALFTSAKLDPAYQADKQRTLGVDRRGSLGEIEQLFGSCTGSVFSFDPEGLGPMDTAVRDCLGVSEEAVGFTRQLRLFCAQPSEEKLDELVKAELRKLEDNADVTGDYVDRLWDCFRENSKAWCETKNNILDGQSDLLASARRRVVMEMRLASEEKTYRIGYRFAPAALASLKADLGRFPRLHVEASECSLRLSCTKVLQSVEGSHLFLGIECFLENHRVVNSGKQTTLVIAVDDSSVVDDAVASTMGDISFSSQKRIVIVSSKDNATANVLVGLMGHDFARFSDIFAFSSFGDDSKSKFLDTTISLQGCQMSLTMFLKGLEIDEHLSASTVVKIIESGVNPSFGPMLPDGVDYYVARTLEQAFALNASILCKAENMTIVHSTPEDIKTILLIADPSLSPECVTETLIHLEQSPLHPDANDPSVSTGAPLLLLGTYECQLSSLSSGQGTALRIRPSKNASEQPALIGQLLFVLANTDEQAVTTLSRFNESNHLLLFANRTLSWVESECNIDFIREHIDTTQTPEKLTVGGESRVLERVTDASGRFVIICAEPGMGKSTLMARLAHTTRRDDGSRNVWVILVSLNDHCALFAEDKHKHAFQFLSEAAGLKSALEQDLFRLALEVTGNVVVLIDGFDEVASRYEKECCILLSRILETKAKKVWLTSRDTIQTNLENRLSHLATKLCPFDTDDQKRFLQQFWMSTKKARKLLRYESVSVAEGSTLSENSLKRKLEERLDDFIPRLLELSSEAIKKTSGGKEFLGIPLQMHMMAEIYEDGVFGPGAAHIPDDKPTLSSKMDLVTLIDQFVEKKLRIYVQDKLKIKKTNPNYHIFMEIFGKKMNEINTISALVLIMNDQDLGRLHVKTFEKKSKKIFTDKYISPDQTGLLNIVNGKPNFIHRVFAEYFVARWLAKRFEKNAHFVSNKLFTAYFSAVRNLLDRILAKDHQLHIAVINEDVDEVHTLLASNIDVHARDLGGRTALHLAAALGTSEVPAEAKKRSDILDALISRTTDVNLEDNVLRGAPLRYADISQYWDAIDKLLRSPSADTKLLAKTSRNFSDPYMLKCIFAHDLDGLLAFCLDQGLPVEHAPEGCNRLLCDACKHGAVRVATLLVKRCASVEQIDGERITPLHCAATNGRESIVQLLLQAMPSDARKVTLVRKVDHNGNTALHKAANKGHTTTVRALLEATPGDMEKTALGKKVDRDGNTALHIAAWNGHTATVNALLAAIPDKMENTALVNQVNKVGHTALHRAAWNGHTKTVRAILEAIPDDMEKTPLVNKVDKFGNTAMHIAAWIGNTETVQALLEAIPCDVEKTAFVKKVDTYGNTSLHIAAWLGHTETVQALLETIPCEVEKTALINKTDKDGNTALHRAAWIGNTQTVRALLEAIPGDVEKTALVNQIDKDGNTALHLAASKKHTETVQALLEAKPGDVETSKLVNKINDINRTAPHRVAWSGYRETVQSILKAMPGDTEKIALINNVDKDGNTALHRAAWIGNKESVQALLAAIPDVEEKTLFLNQLDNDGNTALHLAAWIGHTQTVRTLLEATSTDMEKTLLVNKVNKYGNTPLHIAVVNEHTETLQALVKAIPGDMEKTALLDKVDEDGNTALHVAALKGHTATVRALLATIPGDMEKILLVNKVDSTGNTALHVAAWKGHAKTAHALLEAIPGDLEKTVIVNKFNEDGDTALHKAAYKGHAEIVQALLEAIPGDLELIALVNRVNKDGNTALQKAVERGHTETVQALLRALTNDMDKTALVKVANKHGNTALHIAVDNEQIETVQALLEAIPNDIEKTVVMNTANELGYTAMQSAARFGHTETVRALLQAMSGEMAKTALVNKVDKDGNTALHMAAWKGHTETIQALLEAIPSEIEKTVMVNKINKVGYTALQIAGRFSHTETVQALLEEISDGIEDTELVNIVIEVGKTALQKAAERGQTETVQALLDAIPSAKEKITLVNKVDEDKNTALHIAASRGHTKTVQTLLEAMPGDMEKFALVNKEDKYGDTALHRAALVGHTETVIALLQAIPDGADKTALINKVYNDGSTTLHVAAWEGHTETVRALLEAIPSEMEKTLLINKVSEVGNTAMHRAAWKGHTEIVRALLESLPGDMDKSALLNKANSNGHTALHIAVDNGNTGTVQALLEAISGVTQKTALLNKVDEEGNTALHVAALKGLTETVQALLEAMPGVREKTGFIKKGDKYGNTALHKAALFGHAGTVRALLNAMPGDKKKTALVKKVNTGGKTALQIAQKRNYSDVIQTLSQYTNWSSIFSEVKTRSHVLFRKK